MRKFIFIALFAASFCYLAASVHAATYYISPSGSDVNSGTSVSGPWKTFGKIFNTSRTVKAGDTLVLLDGTYTKATTGLPDIDCTTNANNGTQGSIITVRSQNERRAKIIGDGSQATFQLSNCSFYRIEGLYGEGADNPNNTNSNAYVFSLYKVTDS